MPHSDGNATSYWSSDSGTDRPGSAVMSSIKQRLAQRRREIKHTRSTSRDLLDSTLRASRRHHGVEDDNQQARDRYPFAHSRDTSDVSLSTMRVPSTPQTRRSLQRRKAHVLLGLDVHTTSPMDVDTGHSEEHRTRTDSSSHRRSGRRSPMTSPRSPYGPRSKAHVLLGIKETSACGSFDVDQEYGRPWETEKALPELPPDTALRSWDLRSRPSSVQMLEQMTNDDLISPRTLAPLGLLRYDSVMYGHGSMVSSEADSEVFDDRGHAEAVVWNIPVYDQRVGSRPRKAARRMSNSFAVEELDFDDLGLWYESYGFDQAMTPAERTRISADSVTIVPQ